MAKINSFALVRGETPAVLILGSIPGVASLAAVQYYAHPRNAFWPIMSQFFNFELSESYEQRLHQLTEKNVALWDVLRQCERSGSLDSAIKTATIVPNDIAELLAQTPSIRAIMLNGGKAAQVFKKHFKSIISELPVVIHELPSTSPAYAAMSVDEKTQRWHQALTQAFLV